MSRTRRLLASVLSRARTHVRVLLACLLALGFAGCQQTLSLTATELTADVKPAEAASLEASDGSATYDFALNLLRASVDETSGESTLVSPLSVLYALAMAENGAGGETLAQMEQVTGMSADELTDTLQAYLLRADADDSPLSLANSVWLRDSEGLAVEDSFLETCGGRLGAQVFSAPFDDSTVADVNAWINEKTHEMIPNMLDRISDGTQLLLVNALAFEGAWEEPFDSALVTPDTFTSEDGTERDVDMMHSTEGTYLEGELATGFAKPYEGYDYLFVGLLPAEGVTVAELLEDLDGEGLSELLEPVDNAVVQVGLPKFTGSHEVELSDALRALGMTDAFEEGVADFTRMGSSDAGPLYVGGVLHKTFIDVDEKGTRAAAATAVAMDGADAPIEEEPEVKEVILDRPFVYLILDQATMTPVFTGTVA